MAAAAAASSSSSVYLRCRRLFLNKNNAERDCNNKLKPLLLPRKSHMLRSSSASANVPIPIRAVCLNNTTATTTTTTNPASIYSPSAADLLPYNNNHHHQREASKTMDNELDEWILDSITEIVKNIGEAPFLVHIYSSDGGDDRHDGSSFKTKMTSRPRLEREQAVSEDWPRISRRWKENSSSRPDGILLVEQLKGNEEEEEEEGSLTEYCCSPCSRSSSSSWGIVIQGRHQGLDRAACYILKTCRVSSSVGFCTHFCLVKAKCFGEAAELQFRDSWLQRQ